MAMLGVAVLSVATNRYLLPFAERTDNALVIMNEICDVATVAVALAVGIVKTQKAHLTCGQALTLSLCPRAPVTDPKRPFTCITSSGVHVAAFLGFDLQLSVLVRGALTSEWM